MTDNKVFRAVTRKILPQKNFTKNYGIMSTHLLFSWGTGSIPD